MSQQEPPRPSERQIQDKLFFETLPKKYPDSVIVKNWLGWSYRGREERRESTKFYREFDIAVFERKVDFASVLAKQPSFYSLVLTGFEVKGFEEKSGKPPSFAEGLEQAIVYLHQGADFAYLVHPEPKDENDKKALNELCDRFAQHIGLIFVPHDLGKLTPPLSPYRYAQPNFQSMPDKKRNMLTSLVTWGLRDEISEIPLWCKQQKY